jgi:ABC-type phosphate/phosphonate transport system substrate-binding protein
VEELYLNTVLLRNHFPEIPKFFMQRKDAKNANIALMDVFFNKSDVTVVRENDFNTAIELNPQISSKLIVLDKSEPYMTMVGVVSKHISEDEYKSFVDSFTKNLSNDKGKALLDLVTVSSVKIVTPEDMRDLQDLIRENASLKKSRGNLIK